MHHSPQRIEILTAFYKHPLEIVAESMLAAALLYLCLGVSPRGVLVISIVSGVAGLFYHWNIATPRWLGYIVQRPESHCVHHETGVHAYNYSELPLVDMLFGTFRNPARFDGQCGFGPRGETAIGGLLLGRDVGDGRRARASRRHQGVRTIFPMARRPASRSWATRTSSSGRTVSIWGCTAPDATQVSHSVTASRATSGCRHSPRR